MKITLLLSIGFWVGLILPSWGQEPQSAESLPRAETRRPNIVLILADDLGYGELGSYGQTKIKTPHLDRLAREGMRFTRSYTGAPVCAPARCVLMTGKHLPTAQIRGNRENPRYKEGQEGQWPLAEGTLTMAHVLREGGYRTGGFGKWGLGNAENSGSPLAMGFDTFYGYYCQRVAHSYFPPYLNHNEKREALNVPAIPGHFKVPQGEDRVDFARFQGRIYAPDRILEESLQFVRENKDEPFFLYLPFVEPHVAMQPPTEWVEQYPEDWDAQPYLGRRGYTPHARPRAGYAAMISDLDEHVGTVMAELDALGLSDHTLILFTSDNGPTHDVGGVDTQFFDSTGGLRGRKGSLWEGGIRIPMIARWPGVVEAGSTCARPTGFHDLLPTLCELADLDAPQGLDGVSLAECLTDGAQGPRSAPLLWEFHGYGGQHAVLFPNDMKAIRQKLHKEEQAWQLYDLASDPSESENIADQHPEWVAKAEALMLATRTVSPVFRFKKLDPENKQKE